MQTCDGCGKPLKGGVGIGGAHLCRHCAEDVRAEIDRTRKEGVPVNALGIARRLFREAHSAGAYLLRDIPDDLWTAVRHRAVDEEGSIRDVVLAALRAYLKS